MKIENQVCTLAQAKRLKELGIKHESYFVFGATRGLITESWSVEGDEDDFFDAYTVAELGIMLPDLLTTHLQYELVCIKEADDEWLCRYCRNNDMLDTYPQLPNAAGKTEAQARAAELIYLLENNLTNPEDCNKRLQE